MKTVEVELTFDEIEMLMDAMTRAKNTLEHYNAIDKAAFDKLCSRLRLIDKCHTVMLTAAMHDDNPSPINWADFAKMDEPTDD